MINNLLSRIIVVLLVGIFPLKEVSSEVFIVAKVNEEIITNVDLEFEKNYLISLNPNLKRLDQDRISEYAKNSLINEKIKRIEIEKKKEIIPNKKLLSKVIGDIYTGIGISSLEEFKNYLFQNNVEFEKVKIKIAIEIAWNDLIIENFRDQIEIDANLFKEDLEKFEKKEVENLQLSEIIFTISEKKEFNTKYNEIKESINEIGFEETARIYSLSSSKKSGGNLGWIYKSQLTQEILDGLKEIDVGDFTKPIITSGGFLILKLNDIKKETIAINKDEQLRKMIEFERNRQLTRYSTLYYKRIFNKAEIDEK